MSSIVDPYGYPVSSRLLFAADQRSGARPRWPTQLRDTKSDINLSDWKTVVSASRRLYANYGILKGAVHQKALHSVGRAWGVHFLGSDASWGQRAKEWLENEWFGICDVRGPGFDFRTSLYLDSIAIDRDGDFFTILTQTESGYPAIQHVPAHRVGVRDPEADKLVKEGPFKGYRIEQGVILNELNRPVAYRILGEEESEDRDKPAAFVQHGYDPEYPDQIRGLPAFSHALNEIRDAMQSETWEQHAMLIASTIGLIEYNDNGAIDPNDPGIMLGATGNNTSTLTTKTLEGGLVRYYKAGSGQKLEAFAPERPTERWEAFHDKIVRKALLGVNWPYSLCWKPDGMNGTQERSEIEKARAAILDRQDVLMPIALRQVRWAITKAIKLELLPRSADWYKWSFNLPPKFSIDPGRDGNHAREQFKLGMLNMHQILGEQGTDYETHQSQRESEIVDVITRTKKISESTGVPFEIVLQFFQQRSPNPPVQAMSQGAPAPQDNESTVVD